jgi:hypothetical protein
MYNRGILKSIFCSLNKYNCQEQTNSGNLLSSYAINPFRTGFSIQKGHCEIPGVHVLLVFTLET